MTEPISEANDVDETVHRLKCKSHDGMLDRMKNIGPNRDSDDEPSEDLFKAKALISDDVYRMSRCGCGQVMAKVMYPIQCANR